MGRGLNRRGRGVDGEGETAAIMSSRRRLLAVEGRRGEERDGDVTLTGGARQSARERGGARRGFWRAGAAHAVGPRLGRCWVGSAGSGGAASFPFFFCSHFFSIFCFSKCFQNRVKTIQKKFE